MAGLINELARMTAFFQARTIATVIGADPNSTVRDPDGSVRLSVGRAGITRPRTDTDTVDACPFRDHRTVAEIDTQEER